MSRHKVEKKYFFEHHYTFDIRLTFNLIFLYKIHCKNTVRCSSFEEFLVKNRIALQSPLSENFNSKHLILHLKFRENCDAYLHFPFQNLVSITDPSREFHTNNRCKLYLKLLIFTAKVKIEKNVTPNYFFISRADWNFTWLSLYNRIYAMPSHNNSFSPVTKLLSQESNKFFHQTQMFLQWKLEHFVMS